MASSGPENAWHEFLDFGGWCKSVAGHLCLAVETVEKVKIYKNRKNCLL